MELLAKITNQINIERLSFIKGRFWGGDYLYIIPLRKIKNKNSENLIKGFIMKILFLNFFFVFLKITYSSLQSKKIFVSLDEKNNPCEVNDLNC